MRLLTYQMPDELIAIAKQGEFDEFDLGEFFAATGTGAAAAFKHKNEVQKWLDIIRGAYAATQVDNLKLGAKKPPFPYSDVRLLPYLNHSFWFLPTVASCHAMANLLAEKQNIVLPRLQGAHRRRDRRRGRPGRAAAGARGDRQRPRHQDDHPVLRQAHHRRDGAAVVVDPDAAQPQLPGDLLPGRVPGAVAVVDQEPQRRRPQRGGDPQAGLLRLRLRPDPGAAPDRRVRRRSVTRGAPTPRTPSRSW